PDMAARTLRPITIPGYPPLLRAYVGYLGPLWGPEVSHVLVSAAVRSAGAGAAGAGDGLADHCAQRVHVGLGRSVAEGEAQRAAGPHVVGAHRQQHVTGLGHARGARRTGRAGDAAGVEQQEERV